MFVHETTHAWKRLASSEAAAWYWGLVLGLGWMAVQQTAQSVGFAAEQARLIARRSTAARSALVDLFARSGTAFRSRVLQSSRFGSPSEKRTGLAEVP